MGPPVDALISKTVKADPSLFQECDVRLMLMRMQPHAWTEVSAKADAESRPCVFSAC